MVTHIVLFKLKDGSAVNIGRAVEALRGLEGKVPALRGLEVGPDVMRSERSYHIALVAKFSSIEDVSAYQAHPEHVPVARYMQEACTAIAAVDYES